MLNVFLPIRYLLLLMGMNAFFCGIIYNDFLALSVNMFGSCYPVEEYNHDTLIVEKDPNCNYGFGLDPIWK